MLGRWAALFRVYILALTYCGIFVSPTSAEQSDSTGDPRSTLETQGPAPSSTKTQLALIPHRFGDRTNILLFSSVGVFRGLDYASTRNFQARGRQEILLPDDVVNNSAGFAALEAAGAATSVGISYIFHRTGHHRLERWISIGHIGVTGFGIARNYSLKTKHR